MGRLMLEENKEKSRACKVLWNDDVGFEIGEGQYRHTVNLTNRYRKDTFLKAYSHFVQPIPNMKIWPETNNPRIEPPEPKQMPGRPPRNRRKSKDQPRKKYVMMSKQGVKITCSKCEQQGHNKKYRKLATLHNLLLVKVHKEVAILNQQAPTNLDQQDSTNLYQQHQIVILLQQKFLVIPVVLRGQGKLQKQANHHHLWIQVFLGRVATGEDSVKGGPKRTTNGGSSNVGFGIYTNASGTQILNSGTSSQRILPKGLSYKDASLTGIDLVFKPTGLRWKNKDVVTTS
ncbi:hypothetical protein H5410_056314 [Solanum commersonii]|uniref:Uncharacterized protein n=1 Tax=Solanum commersonii TaxID=4109 RepID=A0A9J5WLW8_SOLCO|nr:hypothetical protein H5410_056314 [Solanum commersonii]